MVGALGREPLRKLKVTSKTNNIMKQVYLMIYDLGGGHRNTANALREEIERRQLPWQVHIVEFFRDIVGTDAPHKVYNNFVLKKKWAKIINEPLLVSSGI